MGCTYVVTHSRDVVPKQWGHYLSFPGLCRTAERDLLLGYRDARAAPGIYAHGSGGDFKLIRHDGTNWSRPMLLYSGEGPLEEMGCGDLTRLSDGTLILWSRQWNSVLHRTHASYLAVSRDGGHTFMPRRAVSFDDFPKGWAPYGKVIELDVCFWLQGGYGVRRGETLLSSACLVSRDRGDTWEVLSWIAVGDAQFGRGYNEPLMLHLKDGSLLCLLRANDLLYTTHSVDKGQSWTPPKFAIEGMACAGLALRSGDVVVLYRGLHHETLVEGRPETVMPRVGRLYCCRVSHDGGEHWGPELEIDNGTAHLAGSYGMGDAIELADGRLQVVYYTSDRDQMPWLRECLLEPVPVDPHDKITLLTESDLGLSKRRKTPSC